MSRHPKGDPRNGGYVRIWARAWLSDSKLNALSLKEQGAFVRLLACAQILNWETGSFDTKLGRLSKREIQNFSGIKISIIESLIDKGFLSEESELIRIRNWNKWQFNPNSTGEESKSYHDVALQPSAVQPSTFHPPAFKPLMAKADELKKLERRHEDNLRTLEKASLSDEDRATLKLDNRNIENRMAELREMAG